MTGTFPRSSLSALKALTSQISHQARQHSRRRKVHWTGVDKSKRCNRNSKQVFRYYAEPIFAGDLVLSSGRGELWTLSHWQKHAVHGRSHTRHNLPINRPFPLLRLQGHLANPFVSALLGALAPAPVLTNVARAFCLHVVSVQDTAALHQTRTVCQSLASALSRLHSRLMELHTCGLVQLTAVTDTATANSSDSQQAMTPAMLREEMQAYVASSVAADGKGALLFPPVLQTGCDAGFRPRDRTCIARSGPHPVDAFSNVITCVLGASRRGG